MHPMSAPPPERLDVAVLGATGMVGQRFLELLDRHPRFRARHLCASDRSAGRRYADAAPWRLDSPALHGDTTVLPCDPDALPQSSAPRIAFSALDKDAARIIEPRFRDAGYRVISNASAFRMDPAVPLLIPELNPDHTRLLDPARPGAIRASAADGYIVCNPNCTCIPMTFVLAALHRAFGVRRVCCASYQAVSGAGYPGESAWDILGNVRPHPGDEEQKVAEEPRKILGTLSPTLSDPLTLTPAPFPISARCVRVPVTDGHLVAVQAELEREDRLDQIVAAIQDLRAPIPLPSSPVPLIRLHERRDRPQPRLDAAAGNGMAITVGRVERCEVFTVKFFALAHNAIRGAAGGAIGNAELLDAQGLL